MNRKLLLGLVGFVLVALTLATTFVGTTDIGDYADTALAFAGQYEAGLRNSHSYLWGFVHAPFVALFGLVLAFKLTSLLLLALLVWSVWFVSGKKKESLWLALLAPAVWYSAPWIGPIQAASVCLLWAWHFLETATSWKKVLWSGLLIGVGWAIWDTVLFFGILLGLVYLWKRRLWEVLIFVVAVFVGLLPRLILDQMIFGFAFWSVVKSFMGTVANLSGGIYERVSGHSGLSLLRLVGLLMVIPAGWWAMYRRQHWKHSGQAVLWLSFCLVLVLANAQMRYVLALAPVMLVVLGRELGKEGLKRHLLLSAVAVLLVSFPYVIQVGAGVGGLAGEEFSTWAGRGFSLERGVLERTVLAEDLALVAETYGGERFLVGPAVDGYADYARWFDGNIRFVSVQDYVAWQKGDLVLLERELAPLPADDERRQWFVSGGMRVNERVVEGFGEIRYGLSSEEELGVGGFVLKEKIGKLNIWERR